MALTIQPARKYETKLRLALAGPSGSGKTYTTLVLATALAETGKIVVIDTERGSSSLYATPDLFAFDLIPLTSYSPESYIEALQLAESKGYEVIIVDTLSQEWNGTGGVLEIVDSIAARSNSNNKFVAWSQVTPRHNRLVDTLVHVQAHLFVTLRSKQGYVLDYDEQSRRTTPRKVGLEPIQRDGLEYEFDIFAEMDLEHRLIVQKSRCPHLADQIVPRPGSQMAELLKDWLKGEPAPLTAKQVYEHCLRVGVCPNQQGFYSYATDQLNRLNMPVTKENVMHLTQEQLRQIRDAAKGEEK